MYLTLSSVADKSLSLPVAMVGKDFSVTSALLKLATVYKIENLRDELLRRLGQSWPTTLAQWEIREKSVVNEEGVYAPRPKLPHPMCVLNLSYAFIGSSNSSAYFAAW